MSGGGSVCCYRCRWGQRQRQLAAATSFGGHHRHHHHHAPTTSISLFRARLVALAAILRFVPFGFWPSRWW